MKTKGIFVGLSTLDIIYRVTAHPLPNQKIAAQSQQIYVGGPAANAAVTFAFLGGSATLVTPIGRHPLATVIHQDLRHFGIDVVDLVPKSLEVPPISSVWVDAGGNRSVVSANAAGIDIPSSTVDPVRMADADIVMVDGHAMQGCQDWAEAARSAGVPVVLDGGSWKPGTDLLLSNIDVAVCSADFLPPGCSEGIDVINYLLAAGVERVAITRGPNPVQWRSNAGSGSIKVPQIEAIDTTGAGDVFHGAFCFHYGSCQDFEESLRRAAFIATESCRYRGTRQWMQNFRSDPASG